MTQEQKLAYLSALISGNLSYIQELAKDNPDWLTVPLTDGPETLPDQAGYPPIYWATKHGHPVLVLYFIAHGVDTQTRLGVMQYHLLHIAAMSGHVNVVKILLNINHAALDAIDAKGQTAVLWGAAEGHADVVDFLANAGADLTHSTQAEGEDCHEYQAVHWSVERGHIQTLECLINHGADITMRVGTAQRCPIHIAAQHGHFDMANLLIQKNPELLALTDHFDCTPMNYAMEWLSTSTKNVTDSSLLELDSLLQQLTAPQRQQLMHYRVDFYKNETSPGALQPYLSDLEKKLENNLLLSLEHQHTLTNIDQALLSIISFNKSLLAWVTNRYEFIVFTNHSLQMQLFRQGIDVSVGPIQLTLRDVFNLAYYVYVKTANSLDGKHKREQIYHFLNFPMLSNDIIPVSELFIAIQHNNIEACKQLLKDTPSFLTHIDWETGNTCLIFAAICGHYDICWLLIEAGINLNLQNKAGKTAEECWPSTAQRNPFTKLKQIFRESLSSPELSEERQANLLKKLTTTHRSLLTWPLDDKGNTFLHLAFAGNHADIIKEIARLLEWEILVFTKNIITKATLLSSLAINGNTALCSLLPIKQLNPGEALLNAASLGHLEFCELMLKNGADPNGYVNMQGHSPLSHAAKLKNKKLCLLLLEYGANPMHKNNKKQTAEALWAGKKEDSPFKEASPFDEFRSDLLTFAYNNPGLSKERRKHLNKLILTHPHFLTWDLDHHGNTFLHAAFHANHIQVIRAIVQLPEWPTLSKVKNASNKNLLDIIAAAGHESLYAYRPVSDVRARSWALIYAVQNERESFCKLLLKEGANPNLRTDSKGNSALFHAAGLGNKALCLLLLEYGANPARKNTAGETADDIWGVLYPDQLSPFMRYRQTLILEQKKVQMIELLSASQTLWKKMINSTSGINYPFLHSLQQQIMLAQFTEADEPERTADDLLRTIIKHSEAEYRFNVTPRRPAFFAASQSGRNEVDVVLQAIKALIQAPDALVQPIEVLEVNISPLHQSRL